MNENSIGKNPISVEIENHVNDFDNYDTERLNFPPAWMTDEQAQEILDWSGDLLEHAAKIAVGVYEDLKPKTMDMIVKIDLTGVELFNGLLRLIREVAEETTEPHIREKIITRVREIGDHGE